ncbi:MAG: gliding motility-associated C-terminal domain-containing protein [Bacteroidia bacterium]|nr:gliding motility-associated C-terminal domain-containing protein [Bacteroidia bacterium]MDW8158156.1 gliding motility-associated C-terminal domain-containing protein [Bacteroidia bacterium]
MPSLCAVIIFFLVSFFGKILGAKAQGSAFTTFGSATNLGDNCFRLTPAVNFQSGTIWYTTPINLECPFDYTYLVNLGNLDARGADGIVFVLQQNGTSVVGQAGGAIGYGGIRPSVAIEVDTYDNGPPADIACDHIALHLNGIPTVAAAGPIQAHVTRCDIEDGQFHVLRVRWEPTTQTISVYFDSSLRLTYTFPNLVQDVFGGNPNVWWGYTAATGGLNNEQTICPIWLTNDTICVNEKIQVAFTGAASSNALYLWEWAGAITEPGNGPGPHIVHWLTPGEKKVRLTIQDGNCRFIGLEKTYIVLEAPEVEILASRSFTCDERPIEFRLKNNLPPATVYSWNFGADAIPASANTPGPILVRWTSQGIKTVHLGASIGGCILNTEDLIITVGAPKAPEVEFHPVPTCVNGFMSITPLASPIDTTIETYIWDFDNGIPPKSTEKGPHWVRWLTPGDKTIRLVVIAAGCTSKVAEGIMPILPAPNHRIIINTTLCANDTLLLTRKIIEPANPPYQYRWFTPTGEWISGEELIIFPAIKGKYVSELIDNNYCIARDTIEIELLSNPQVQISFTTPCANSPLILEAVLYDSVASPYRFLWQSENWQAEGSKVIRVPPQHGTYTLKVIDANNCSTIQSQIIELLPPPDFALRANATCVNDTLIIQAIDIQGEPPLSFTWQTPTQQLIQGSEILKIYPSVEGTYKLTVHEKNCSKPDSIKINLLPIPQFDFTIPPTCANKPLHLEVILKDTTGSPFDFIWQAENFKAQGEKIVRNPPHKKENYTIKVTNAYNCAVSQSRVWEPLPLPTFQLQGPPPCENDTLYIKITPLSGTPPFSITWQVPTGQQYMGNNIYKQYPPIAGKYKVLLEDKYCTNIDSIEMRVKKLPSVSWDIQDSLLCAGEKVNLVLRSNCDTCNVELLTRGLPEIITQLGTTSVVWQKAGNYSLKGTVSQEGCIGSNIQEITVHSSPSMEFKIEEAPCELQTYLITQIENAIQAKWQLPYATWQKNITLDKAIFLDSLSFSSAGQYEIKIHAQNSSGCAAIDSMLYHFEPENRLSFSIPNIFTPNEDGINDLLEIPSIIVPCFEKMEILDRWGNQLFVLRNNTLTWNFKDSHNNLLPAGTYYYILTLGQQGKKLQRSGIFSIIY